MPTVKPLFAESYDRYGSTGKHPYSEDFDQPTFNKSKTAKLTFIGPQIGGAKSRNLKESVRTS